MNTFFSFSKRYSRRLALVLFTLAMTAGISRAQTTATDTEVKAGRFDNGKMWTFEHPPIEYFKEAYNFEPDAAWFEKARLGALRIPGCSASFVSPNGLVLTNHHCGRGPVSEVNRPGENLLDNGFYAASLSEERPVEGFYADQLVHIDDVTDEVYAALEGKETDAEKAAARQEAIQAIADRITEEAGGEEAGAHVEVIALYNGAMYSAYTFHRYKDVRLVMTPELQLGYFGGDSDNFTYPRYALDMTLFRVYGEDGKPLRTEHFFKWSVDGTKEGDAIFVIGNPGSTSRLETVAQLEFRRDVREVDVLSLIDTRVAVLQQYYEAMPEEAEEKGIRNQIFGLLNAQKLYRGRVKALRDPVIMGRRKDFERRFRAAIESDPALKAEYGDLHERMADIQQGKREFAPEFGAFLSLQPNSTLSSATMRRAMLAYTYVSRKAQGVSPDALAGIREQIEGIEDLAPIVEKGFLVARMNDFRRYFGDDSEIVKAVFAREMPAMDMNENEPMQPMRTPEEVADDLLAHSALSSAERTAEALASDALSLDDPAIRVAAVIMPRVRAFQSAFAGLGAQEQEVASGIGRARFAVYGLSIPPDATFSLRIADGVVKGYEYNGTQAPTHTTFFGMYDRHYSFGPGTEWDLPDRWLHPPKTFDLDTPLDMVSTADIIGGNSGSPVINVNHELVGLIFDGNIESLSGDYIYLTDKPRAVAVDARGILEALDEIYDADRLVLELTTGRAVDTEAEADDILSGSR